MLEPPLLVTFVVGQVFGLLAVIFVILAAVEENDHLTTFSLTGNFVWHPVLMSLGLVYLFGCAAVIYRLLRFMEKIHVKIVHGGIQMVALALALAGLTLAVQYHSRTSLLAHFSSLHGLFGLITVILFATQWVISIPVFLYPKAPDNIRAPGLAVHVCLGIAVFLSATVTSLIGINMKSSSAYYKTSGFFYFFYSLVTLYTVTLKEYKRPPDF